MKRKLIMVLFITFTVLFSIGCTKKGIPKGRGEEQPKEMSQSKTRFSEVTNAPGNMDFRATLVLREQPDGEYTVMGIVRDIQERALTLEIWDDVIMVYINEDATYQISKIDSKTTQQVEGDQFGKILVDHLIGLRLQIDQDGSMSSDSVLIFRKE